MTEIKPQFLDELSYAAKFDRQFPRDILTEGIVGVNDLKVEDLDTPGMGVKVASGVGYVQGDQATTQGHYRIFNDASKNLTIAASDPTNDRKDRIIAQVYDSVDIGGAEDKWVLEVLTGTPAPSPDPPALPDDALDLAIVLVEDGVTTIVDANITDQRSQITNQNIVIDADMIDTKHASDLVQIAGEQTITGQKTITSPLFVGTLDGWIAAGETWTYASWDADVNTGTITVPSGAANKYSIGMRIKISQSTGGIKYGIIMKVADTTLTVYFGTDYTLNNETISSPYYSTMKAPLGFPLDLDKWTAKLVDTTTRTQGAAVLNTWYNLGGVNIILPIGSWNVYVSVMCQSNLADKTLQITLSNANNSESDTEFTTGVSIYMVNGKNSMFVVKPITVTSKTIKYFNTRTISPGAPAIYNMNGLQPLVLRAVCAYL